MAQERLSWPEQCAGCPAPSFAFCLDSASEHQEYSQRFGSYRFRIFPRALEPCTCNWRRSPMSFSWRDFSGLLQVAEYVPPSRPRRLRLLRLSALRGSFFKPMTRLSSYLVSSSPKVLSPPINNIYFLRVLQMIPPYCPSASYCSEEACNARGILISRAAFPVVTSHSSPKT